VLPFPETVPNLVCHFKGSLHFNPAVSLADAIEGGLAWRELGGYIGAQIFGGIAGTLAAHAMFGLPLISLSRHVRAGQSQFLSEFIAAFGLLCVIWGCSRSSSSSPLVPFAVASYITAAYWFTASTSFANPVVTIARSLSDTFAGIRPHDVPLFVIAQIVGALTATMLFRWLVPGLRAKAKSVVFAENQEAETISPSR
jgi:glycerol uptake facilitator-like aquaporin